MGVEGGRVKQIFALQELRDYLSNRIYWTKRVLEYLRKKSETKGITKVGWRKTRDLTKAYLKELEEEYEMVKKEIKRLQKQELEEMKEERRVR